MRGGERSCVAQEEKEAENAKAREIWGGWVGWRE